MMERPPGVGVFQFVVLASLRAAQLMRGCRPKIDGDHKAIMTAQLEVAQGKVSAQVKQPSTDVADEPPASETVPIKQATTTLGVS